MILLSNEMKSLLMKTSGHHNNSYDETKKLLGAKKYKLAKKLYSNNITVEFTLKDIPYK